MPISAFLNSWEQRKLRDILAEYSEKSTVDNQYRVLSSTNNGMEVRSGRVDGKSNLGYKILYQNDLVLSPQNLWLGNININNLGVGLVSPSYKTFKIKILPPLFFKIYLRSKYMLEAYKNASTQGASVVRRNLEMDLFEDIVIRIPSTLKEQEELEKFFNQVNALITHHQ